MSQVTTRNRVSSPVSSLFEATSVESPDVSSALAAIDEAVSKPSIESIRAGVIQLGLAADGPRLFADALSAHYDRDYRAAGCHRRCLYCGARENTYKWGMYCPQYAVTVPDDAEDW